MWTTQVGKEIDERVSAIERSTADLAERVEIIEDQTISIAEKQEFYIQQNYISTTSTLMEAVATDKPQPRFALTNAERELVERAVMSEARGETYEGQMMVAQAMLDGAERNSWDIETSFYNYRIYVTWNGEISESVKNAVAAVFDNGERVTEEKADLWYAYLTTKSSWHEKQQYVITIGGHKFFWCTEEVSR